MSFPNPTPLRIAIDTGGTFTDCVYLDATGTLQVLKVRSTPHDPATAVLEGVRQIAATTSAARMDIRHGTTVGTNAMLERKGARVAFVTTAGFEDTIAIGRQTRPRLYDFNGPAPPCLVPSALRFGIAERVSAEAEILRSPTAAELATLRERIAASGAEAIAVSLLFSFLRPENELLVEDALRPLGLPISTSHRILPEFREYERASTLVVNAYLAPRMQHYLLSLADNVSQQYGGNVEIMQSSGGIVSAQLAAAEPVRTVLSGPAGGVIGAWRLAQLAGHHRIIGFDMGGTSTDVFLADSEHGGPRLTAESQIDGLPLSVPMLDIHTAGAGGGSIARFDAGGLLRVGPHSAGADPGPICFGRGGVQPTVTDANLILGRLDTHGFMGGSVPLDLERTRARFTDLAGPLTTPEAFAAGVLRVVETNMERAIRVISVERGHDPRQFTLVAFGGGGPLHACALARALRVPTVLIPALPGALSALGILLADSVRDTSRTVMLAGSALDDAPTLETHFAALESHLRADFPHPAAIAERTIDLRYRGQGYELNLPYTPDASERFHALHAARYGFSDPARPLEIVNLRLRLRAPGPAFDQRPLPTAPGNGEQALTEQRDTWFGGRQLTTCVYTRTLLQPGDTLHGPALLSEYTSTTVVPPGCTAVIDPLANIVIHIDAERSA